jgi:hypothetical protein
VKFLGSKVKQQRQWHRTKVLELSSQGRSQLEISKIMQISDSTVNRDVQFLRQEAKKNIQKFIDDNLPFEYQKCSVGLDGVLKKTWDIANKSKSDRRDMLQAMSVGMQAYGMKIDLLSSANVLDRAVQFVQRINARGLTDQNKEVRVVGTEEPRVIGATAEDATESKQDTGSV